MHSLNLREVLTQDYLREQRIAPHNSMYGQDLVGVEAASLIERRAPDSSAAAAASIPKLVLLCGLAQHSVEASVELSRSGWAVTDQSALPEGSLGQTERRNLPCIGLVRVGDDAAKTRQLLEDLDGVLPARFLWLALLEKGSRANDDARALIAEYCFDFFTLPVNWDYLANTLGHALGMLSLSSAQTSLEGFLVDRGIVGESEAMQAFMHGVRKVAQHAEPLMITGEAGTGKAIAARAVHARSLRADKPFGTVNCANYTDTSFSDALFGQTTGAAQGGTLFLANVHALPARGQRELTAILEEKRLGDTDTRPVDVRIICSTTHDAPPPAAHNNFSAQLFHRLNILSLHVPTLRERSGDLHLLARYFLNRYAADTSRRLRGFTKDAQAALTAHTWPGNVRELMSRVRRAVVMCEGRSINAHDLGLEALAAREDILTLEQARQQADVTAIQTALARHRNRLSHAARDLGISRVTLYRLLERYEIRVRAARPT